MDRGAWWVTVYRGCKQENTMEQLSRLMNARTSHAIHYPFICSRRKRNYFGSLLPLCAKGKYSREYSWVFRKQTCEKGHAGAWRSGGRWGWEEKEVRAGLWRAGGSGSGELGGISEQNWAKQLRKSENWW